MGFRDSLTDHVRHKLAVSGECSKTTMAHKPKMYESNLTLLTDSAVPSINLPEATPTTPKASRSSASRRGTPSDVLKGSLNLNNHSLTPVHKFHKVAFKQPTWCVWSNKFIWGLDKTGFECLVSRKFLSDAKLTLCEGLPTLMTVRTGETAAKPLITGSKIFTIHLPEGQRRSVMFNPHQKLSEVISKICRDRDWQVSDYVACDSNGTELDLRMLLGQIKSFEITFTKREAGSSMMRPPLISDVKAKLEAQGLLVKGKATAKRPGVKSSDGSLGVIKQEDEGTHTSEDTSADTTSSKVTRRVKECYTIAEKELGSGAFSIVLEGTDKQTGESVAIKVIERSEAGDSAEQALKFKTEFEIHSSLLHDHIVRFVMMDETDDQYFVVMELVSGGELFDQVIDRGQFEEKDACLLLCQVLTGLTYMHKRGVAHRDLKPENLLFKDKTYSTLKIADFGESKTCSPGSLTTYCGTPDYMAPEIIQGNPYGTEVDMWAMGCISYIMMAGFPPFDGENDGEILANILSVRYDFPSPEWDDYSAESKDFISHLILGDAEKRMNAQQALDHPWMKKHCTDAQRNIPGKEPVLHVQEAGSGSGANTPSSRKRERSKSQDVRVITTQPRGFDLLDLAFFQTPYEDSDPKSLLLRGIEILTSFAYWKAASYVVEELLVILAIINEVPDSDRTYLEDFVLRTYWSRLQAMKTLLVKNLNPKDKDKAKKTLPKSKKESKSVRGSRDS